MASGKVLYLHGLDSHPAPEKVNVFKDFGYEPIAPHLFYREDPEVILKIEALIETHQPEWITGSSLGGYTAFWMGLKYGLPSLLFNPALAFRTKDPGLIQVPEKLNVVNRLIILGLNDDVVLPQHTLNWLEENHYKEGSSLLHYDGLGHQIPLNVFKASVQLAMHILKV
jgi:hypothetical protein